MFKVLIADDEYLMREALKRMVEMVDGFEVCATANTGQEAVDQAAALSPDIIFIDVVMPDLGGIEATKRIKDSGNRAPIYLISAYNEFQFAKEAIYIGVAEYLTKPLGYTDVKRVLETYRGLNTKRDETFESICRCVDAQHYGDMYYRLPDLIADIREESWDSPEEIVEYYYDIESRLFERYACSLETNYVNRPAGKMLPIVRWLEFRLYATLDLIYRHNAVAQYPVMARSFAYIDQHTGDNIGLREVRDDSGLSQGYLSRIFKKTLGISVMSYIHLCRMMQAKWYFCTEDANVTDVAYQLGYNESSYFSKLFKKYEHTTISQYKKMIKQERREKHQDETNS